MSGGQVSVPLVIRMTTGGGRRLAAQHSHSWEVWYAHIPGIKVLAPANATDARYMLAAALADPDPVIIFEHAMLYPESGEVDENAAANGSVWQARVCRAGDDITLVTYGGSVPKTLAAADQLSQSGISAEVIDLRCLRPLDRATMLNSVRRTHRALIVDEGWRTCSLAAELMATIMEEAFYDLDAPVERVCSAEVPLPYAGHLEDAALPQTATIVKRVQEMLARHE
jgi:pyruvate dehydrogenase E1 component beta subunit